MSKSRSNKRKITVALLSALFSGVGSNSASAADVSPAVLARPMLISKPAAETSVGSTIAKTVAVAGTVAAAGLLGDKIINGDQALVSKAFNNNNKNKNNNNNNNEQVQKEQIQNLQAQLDEKNKGLDKLQAQMSNLEKDLQDKQKENDQNNDQNNEELQKLKQQIANEQKEKEILQQQISAKQKMLLEEQRRAQEEQKRMKEEQEQQQQQEQEKQQRENWEEAQKRDAEFKKLQEENRKALEEKDEEIKKLKGTQDGAKKPGLFQRFTKWAGLGKKEVKEVDYKAKFEDVNGKFKVLKDKEDKANKENAELLRKTNRQHQEMINNNITKIRNAACNRNKIVSDISDKLAGDNHMIRPLLDVAPDDKYGIARNATAFFKHAAKKLDSKNQAVESFINATQGIIGVKNFETHYLRLDDATLNSFHSTNPFDTIVEKAVAELEVVNKNLKDLQSKYEAKVNAVQNANRLTNNQNYNQAKQERVNAENARNQTQAQLDSNNAGSNADLQNKLNAFNAASNTWDAKNKAWQQAQDIWSEINKDRQDLQNLKSNNVTLTNATNINLVNLNLNNVVQNNGPYNGILQKYNQRQGKNLELIDFEEQLTFIKNEKDQLVNDKNNKNVDKQNADNALQQAEQNLKQAQNNLQLAQNNNNNIQNNLQNLQAAVGNRQQEFDDANNTVEQCKIDIHDLDQKIRTLNTLITDMNNWKNNPVQDSLFQIQNRIQNYKNQAYKQTWTTLDLLLNAITLECHNAANDVNAKHVEVQNAQNNLNDAKDEFNNSKDQNEQLKVQLENDNQKVTDLQAKEQTALNNAINAPQIADDHEVIGLSHQINILTNKKAELEAANLLKNQKTNSDMTALVYDYEFNDGGKFSFYISTHSDNSAKITWEAQNGKQKSNGNFDLNFTTMEDIKLLGLDLHEPSEYDFTSLPGGKWENTKVIAKNVFKEAIGVTAKKIYRNAIKPGFYWVKGKVVKDKEQVKNDVMDIEVADDNEKATRIASYVAKNRLFGHGVPVIA